MTEDQVLGAVVVAVVVIVPTSIVEGGGERDMDASKFVFSVLH